MMVRKQAGYHAARREELTNQKRCVWCRDAVKSARHVLCAACRRVTAERSATRYAERRRAHLCVRCAASSPDAYLCADCAEQRNLARAARRSRA